MPIKRVVKLIFKKDKVEDFITIFNESSIQIRSMKGCLHLELWQSREPSNVLFTFSLWESEDDLNVYRNSAFFEKTWARTKAIFDGKPEAWSVDVLAVHPTD